MEARGGRLGHLYLSGFMGTGKTTIGALLAQRLRRPFLDLDARICARSGRSVVELFSELGEAGFRRLEREALFSLPSAPPVVLALGGGAVTQPQIKAHLSGGTWISLKAKLETIRARLEGDQTRPLLKAPEALERLYAARAPFEAGADLSVEVDARTPRAIVDEITEALCGR